MKKRFAVVVLVAVVLGLWVPPVIAQTTGSVKGVCKDRNGNLISAGTVEWMSNDTGRKYTLKLNKKGEYFSLGIAPGTYKVTLYDPDGKELFHFGNVPVSLDEKSLDFDLQKEQAQGAKGGLSPEQLKQVQEQQAKQQKEVNTVKSLNDKLNVAQQAASSGDFDTAIATMTEATQIDATRDLLWFKLADYYRLSAPKQTDPAEKQKRFEMAAADYQKAIDLRTSGPDAQKDPEANSKLAAYYNNLAEVYAKSGKVDDAVATYTKASQLDPTHAAQYYFNQGAVMTNAGKVDDAIAAFDKVIAADPTRADAYYWKGVNMIGKATLKGDKMVAPEGTAEAFNKYLELAPTGPYAQPAKDMLTSIGAAVETGYKKPKTTKK